MIYLSVHILNVGQRECRKCETNEPLMQYRKTNFDSFLLFYGIDRLTQNMVYLLLNDGNPILKDERLDKIFPHLEEVGAEFVKESAAQKSNYRLIKTHMVREIL